MSEFLMIAEPRDVCTMLIAEIEARFPQPPYTVSHPFANVRCFDCDVKWAAPPFWWERSEPCWICGKQPFRFGAAS